jgi:hypothetical protein
MKVTGIAPVSLVTTVLLVGYVVVIFTHGKGMRVPKIAANVLPVL